MYVYVYMTCLIIQTFAEFCYKAELQNKSNKSEI